MSNPRAARRYAVALLDAAADQHDLETVAADLATIGAAITASRDLRVLLASPVISTPKKTAVLNEVFGGKVGKAALDFLTLLADKHRENLLSEIITQFNALRDERMGIIVIDVSSAVALSDGQQQELHSRLGQYTGKKVRIRFTLDNAVRGGIVVRIGDTVLDASLQHQLELLRERFVEGSSLTN